MLSYLPKINFELRAGNKSMTCEYRGREHGAAGNGESMVAPFARLLVGLERHCSCGPPAIRQSKDENIENSRKKGARSR